MDKLDKIVYKTQNYGHNPSVWTVQNWIFDLGRFRVQEASGSNPDTPTKIVGMACSIPTIFIVVRDSKDRPERSEGKKQSGGLFLRSWENPIICGCSP